MANYSEIPKTLDIICTELLIGRKEYSKPSILLRFIQGIGNINLF